MKKINIPFEFLFPNVDVDEILSNNLVKTCIIKPITGSHIGYSMDFKYHVTDIFNKKKTFLILNFKNNFMDLIQSLFENKLVLKLMIENKSWEIIINRDDKVIFKTDNKEQTLMDIDSLWCNRTPSIYYDEYNMYFR